MSSEPPVNAETESRRHKMTWDGPFGKTYIERCSCGWSAMTFADTRKTAIGKAHDAHLAEVQQSDGQDAPRCTEPGCVLPYQHAGPHTLQFDGQEALDGTA